MLCLGPKKSLLSPRLELTAQGMAQCTDDKSQVWYHPGTPQLTKGCKTLASAWLLHDTVERLNAGDLNAFAWGEDHNENHKGWSGLKYSLWSSYSLFDKSTAATLLFSPLCLSIFMTLICVIPIVGALAPSVIQQCVQI